MKSLRLQKIEALQKRLPPTHPKLPLIEADLGKLLAGWRGEREVEYQLSFLPKESGEILRDLRLEDSEGRFFQIDTLFLSTKCHIIIEVKNMAGKLFFNDSPRQLVQSQQNEEKAYACPILQVERHREQLLHIFEKLKLPTARVFCLVVISHANTIINFPSTHAKATQCVIPAAAIPTKINSILGKYKQEFLCQKELKKLIRFLVKNNQPLDLNYHEKYNISETELLTGVHCPNCCYLPMQWVQGKWLCPNCNQMSKDTHIKALHDYFLLFNSTITNRQLREFLHITSITTASKLLSSLNIKKSGKNKGSFYDLKGLIKNRSFYE